MPRSGVASMKTVVVQQGPDVQLIGGSACLVQGRAAVDAYRLITAALKAERRVNGLEPSASLLELQASLKAAAGLAPRTPDIADMADVRERPTSAESVSGRQVGVEEVARLLGVGPRQARRLAPSLGGHKKRSGAWVFDLLLVIAYRDHLEGVQ